MPSCDLFGVLLLYMPHCWWLMMLESSWPLDHFFLSLSLHPLILYCGLSRERWPLFDLESDLQELLRWVQNQLNWYHWCSHHPLLHVLPLLLRPSCQQDPDGSSWKYRDSGQDPARPSCCVNNSGRWRGHQRATGRGHTGAQCPYLYQLNSIYISGYPLCRKHSARYLDMTLARTQYVPRSPSTEETRYENRTWCRR